MTAKSKGKRFKEQKIAPKIDDEKITLYSMQPNANLKTSKINIDANWVELIPVKTPFKVCYNVILIIKILFTQLTLVSDLDTTKAMQTETHRTGVQLINTVKIMKFIVASAISATAEFSTLITDGQMVQRYNKLEKTYRTSKSSRLIGIVPSIRMGQDKLNVYAGGLVNHYKGNISIHPIYYAVDVSGYYGIDVTKIGCTLIKSISFYPEHFDQAVDIVKTKVMSKNPHEEAVPIEVTTLMNELGFELNLPTDNDVELLNENEAGLSEEEIDRIRLVNERIKNEK